MTCADIQWWTGNGGIATVLRRLCAEGGGAGDAMALTEGGNALSQLLQLLSSWKAAEAEMAMGLAREPMVVGNFLALEYRPVV